jgi:ABC-type branched-subunit amino acid transport system substrate-binding protein
VGTPTSKAVEPFISEMKVPYIGPFSGAQLLRSPFKRYVVNVRASYFEETEKMAQYYVDDLHYKNIAILYQDDSFGRAGLDGIKKALSKRNMNLAAEATFVRNTVAVKQAVLTIGKVEPQVIVTIGTYAPIAEFVRVYRSLGLNAAFTTVSFVGTEALAQELGSQGKDFIVTEVTPHPYDDSIPVVKEYQKALKQYDEHLSFDYVSLEGYIVGRFAAQILEGMGDDITREKFLDAIYKAKDIRVAGLPMSFGPEDNQGLSVTYMSKIMGDGSFVSFNGQNK